MRDQQRRERVGAAWLTLAVICCFAAMFLTWGTFRPSGMLSGYGDFYSDFGPSQLAQSGWQLYFDVPGARVPMAVVLFLLVLAMAIAWLRAVAELPMPWWVPTVLAATAAVVPLTALVVFTFSSQAVPGIGSGMAAGVCLGGGWLHLQAARPAKPNPV